MAVRWRWFTLIVVLCFVIHYNSLEVEGGGKKYKKHGDNNNCCKKYKSYYPSHKKYRCYDDCWDDCCCPYYCCCCCDDNDDCDDDKKKDKKDKKDDKFWKKLMKKDKKDKKNKKDKKKKKSKSKSKSDCDCDCCCCCCCCNDDWDCYDDNDCCCCDGQKIIVEKGPAIIQTIILDKDCYSKYCSGCYGDCNPLQKIVVNDGECYKYPTCYGIDDCCDSQQCVNVVAKDPCCKYDYYGNYGSYYCN